MANVSGEITASGRKYEILDYRIPQLNELFLSEGQVHQRSWPNIGDIAYIIVKEKQIPWRVPTDTDAKNRPQCRVSNMCGHWEDAVLLHVSDCLAVYRFAAINAAGLCEHFKFCEIQDV